MVHLLQVNAGLPVPVAVLGAFIRWARSTAWCGSSAPRLIRGLRDRRRAHRRARRRGRWPSPGRWGWW
ncbi:MAG: hypothetical protein HS111_30630 [Kofleriaceae bacterium]|nr:hypothetical protein [Kofleriaceae bacterium]